MCRQQQPGVVRCPHAPGQAALGLAVQSSSASLIYQRLAQARRRRPGARRAHLTIHQDVSDIFVHDPRRAFPQSRHLLSNGSIPRRLFGRDGSLIRKLRSQEKTVLPLTRRRA